MDTETAERLARHDEQIKTLFGQQKEIKALAESTNKLAISVERLTNADDEPRRAAGRDRGGEPVQGQDDMGLHRDRNTERGHCICDGGAAVVRGREKSRSF